MSKERKNSSSSHSSRMFEESNVYDSSIMVIEKKKEKRSDDDVSASSKLTDKEKAAHINLCANLVQQGKVNIENAFDLHGTKYLSQFVAREETTIEDAYKAVSACTKIYSVRVDVLHKKCKQFGNKLAAMMEDDMEAINQAEASEKVPENTAQCQSRKERKDTASSAENTGEKRYD